MNLLRLAVLGLLLVGCGFKPAAGSNGDDAHPVIDAPGTGSDDASTVLGPCGTVGAIRDDFNDNLAGNQWGVVTPAQTTETGGELVVTPVGVMGVQPMPVAQFMGYYSKHAVDLTGGTVTAEVTAMVDTSSTMAYAEFGAVNSRNNFVLIVESHGMISFDSNDGLAMGTLSGTTPYDPVAHRWWRIVQTGTTIVGQVSPDGVAWTTIGTPLAKPAWSTRVNIALGGANSDLTPHGAVHFDNLNQDLIPAGWCPAHSLTDQFERSTVGLEWNASYLRPQMPCVPTINDNAFFDQTGMSANRCELTTSQGFDLTNDHVMIYVASITDAAPSWTPFLRVVSDEVQHAFYLQFEEVGTVFRLCAQVDSNAETCINYDADNDLYWRIGEQNNSLVFDTSIDTVVWTPVATVPINFAVNAVDVEIGTAVSAPFAPGINFAISAYNNNPPL